MDDQAPDDVTDTRRSAALLTAHVTFANILAGWTSIERDGARVVEAVGRGFGAFRGAIYVDRDSHLVPVAFWQDHDPGRDAILELDLRRGTGVTGRAFDRREPLVVRDVTAVIGPHERALVAADGIRGFVAAPLVDQDAVVAAMVFAWHGVLELSPEQHVSLEVFTRVLGSFLARRPGELEAPLLSGRERELLQLAANGISGREIAGELHISTETVKSHFKHIYAKLGVSDRTTAVANALRLGLVI